MGTHTGSLPAVTFNWGNPTLTWEVRLWYTFCTIGFVHYPSSEIKENGFKKVLLSLILRCYLGMRLRSYVPLYSVTISTELGHITLSGWDVVVGGVSETCTVSLGASDVYRSTLKFYFLTPSWSCKLDGKHKRRKWLLSTHMAAGTRLFFFIFRFTRAGAGPCCKGAWHPPPTQRSCDITWSSSWPHSPPCSSTLCCGESAHNPRKVSMKDFERFL